MNLGFRQSVAILAALFYAINVPAQNIPLLPGDSSVIKGLMPNGMAYYLVSNPDEKGMADFALVQKTGLLTVQDTAADKVHSVARDAFRSLKRIGKSYFKDYLIRYEVIPEKEGIVRVTDDATVFRLDNVRIDSDAHVLDSTLLMIMDIADRANYSDDAFVREWYSPSDQAVIVSGDIDSKSVAEKLRYMSFMIPSRVSSSRPDYVSEQNSGTDVVRKGNKLVEVSMKLVSERAPREYMNTIQPEIFEMSFNILGDAAVRRIRKSLMSMEIPFADVSYEHMCSSEYPYDDSFTVSATVDESDEGITAMVIDMVMAAIDADGLLTEEYLMSESTYMQRLTDEAEKPVRTNDEYVERCRNAFLYNSSLASVKERLAFQKSRNLPDTMRQRLFNGIASALIVKAGAKYDDDDIDVSIAEIDVPDTLFRPVAPLKMKLKSVKKEPVSGGSIWTFSNGVKVIYKRMNSDRLYYALALNGGYGSIEYLGTGEGAFIGDYLKTCRICDMSADDFLRVLGKEGITMDMAVNMSGMTVSGSLPKRKMGLLMRSLLAVANERYEDAGRYEYYAMCENLSLGYGDGGRYSMMTAIDSIMCPGYKFSPYKVKGRMTEDFAMKAEGYFERQFSKINDGVLVIAGNIDEESLKKVLLEYVGHFRTTDFASVKPKVRYQPVSGCSTYTVEGDSDNVYVAISTRMPFTMDNYLAAELASMILKRELARSLNESGLHFKLSHNCVIYPEERLNMLISIPSASLSDFSEVRTVLAGLESIEITDKDLKSYKETLKNRLSREMKSPSYWTSAIALRYIDGKDLSTNYAAKTDAVTPDKVKSVLALLDSGSKVEYVTIKK